jgi:hypothetical protein
MSCRKRLRAALSFNKHHRPIDDEKGMRLLAPAIRICTGAVRCFECRGFTGSESDLLSADQDAA